MEHDHHERQDPDLVHTAEDDEQQRAEYEEREHAAVNVPGLHRRQCFGSELPGQA